MCRPYRADYVTLLECFVLNPAVTVVVYVVRGAFKRWQSILWDSKWNGNTKSYRAEGRGQGATVE